MLKRFIAVFLLFLMAVSPVALTGCRPVTAAEGEFISPGPYVPEAGQWHAEVKLSDLSDVIPFWARALIAIAAGNTAFEVDAHFSTDGTFTYETNTGAMKKTIDDSANTLLGLFLKDIDLSVFIDRAVEAILPETVMGKDRDCYGTYERQEDGMLLVTTTTGETLYFKCFGKRLVQLQEDGTQILAFSRAE